jgi:hypothetical protein
MSNQMDLFGRNPKQQRQRRRTRSQLQRTKRRPDTAYARRMKAKFVRLCRRHYGQHGNNVRWHEPGRPSQAFGDAVGYYAFSRTFRGDVHADRAQELHDSGINGALSAANGWEAGRFWKALAEQLFGHENASTGADPIEARDENTETADSRERRRHARV